VAVHSDVWRAAVFLVALGLTVLAGWFSHTTSLIQFKPHLPPMTRNVAACFLLSGLALRLVVRIEEFLAATPL
jgi:hypothetical protein